MTSGPFREFISEEHAEFKPEANRYIVYAAHVCPFAQRALLARALKKLENIVQVVFLHSVNDPPNGWRFDSELGVDPVLNAKHLRELYQLTVPDYSGRITVPVLFDSKTRKIVNNESADIVRMFNTCFNKVLTGRTINLYPADLADQIDNKLQWVLDDVCFGVYKCGFAKTQEDYEGHIKTLFKSLDRVEEILGSQSFLAGNILTEADVKVFPWIARLAPVYEGVCKVNLKSLRYDIDYPNVSKWLRKIYQLPGIPETMDMKQVVEGNYINMAQINPSKLVPLYRGPDLSKPAVPLADSDFAWF